MNPNNFGFINEKFNNITDHIINNAFLTEHRDKLGQDYKRRILSEFTPNAFPMHIPFNNILNGPLNPDMNTLSVPITAMNIPITTNSLLSTMPPHGVFNTNSVTGSQISQLTPQQTLPYNVPNPTCPDFAIRFLTALNAFPPQAVGELISQNIATAAALARANMAFNTNLSPKAVIPNIPPPQPIYDPNLFFPVTNRVNFPFSSTVPSPTGSSSSSCNASEIDALEDRFDDVSVRRKERPALVPIPEPSIEADFMPMMQRVKAQRARESLCQQPEASGRVLDDARNPFINGQHLMNTERIETSAVLPNTIPADYMFYDQDMENEDVFHVSAIVPNQKAFEATMPEEERMASISPSQAVPITSSASHSPNVNMFAFGETDSKRRKLSEQAAVSNGLGNEQAQQAEPLVWNPMPETLPQNDSIHQGFLDEVLKVSPFLSTGLGSKYLEMMREENPILQSFNIFALANEWKNSIFPVPLVPTVEPTLLDQPPQQSVAKTTQDKPRGRPRKSRVLAVKDGAIQKKERAKKIQFNPAKLSEMMFVPTSQTAVAPALETEGRVQGSDSKVDSDPISIPISIMLPEPEGLIERAPAVVDISQDLPEALPVPEFVQDPQDEPTVAPPEEPAPEPIQDMPVVVEANVEEGGDTPIDVCTEEVSTSSAPMDEMEVPKKRYILKPQLFEDIVMVGRMAKTTPGTKPAKPLPSTKIMPPPTFVGRGRPTRLAALVAAAAVRSDSVTIRRRKGKVAVGTYTAQDEVDTEGNEVVTHDPTLSCGSADICFHPDQLSLAWIRCDFCSTWFHRICTQYLANIRVMNNDLFICGCVTSTGEVLYKKGFFANHRDYEISLIEKIVKITNAQIALRKRASVTGENRNAFSSEIPQADIDEVEDFLNSETVKHPVIVL